MNIIQEKVDSLNAVLKVQIVPEDYKPAVDTAIALLLGNGKPPPRGMRRRVRRRDLRDDLRVFFAI